jgi:hypothetical protein
LEYVIIIVSILSSENIFETENKTIEEDSKPKVRDLNNLLDVNMYNPLSDHITYMNLILNLLRMNYKTDRILIEYCRKYYLNVKKIRELVDLVQQLCRIANIVFKENITFVNMIYPNSEQQNLLFQILLSGHIDNIARKKIIYDKVGNEKDVQTVRKMIYECNNSNEQCYIHNLSVIAKAKPDLLIYKEIIKENKSFLIMNTIIKPEWLFELGGKLVSYSNDNHNAINEPFYNRKEDKLNCYIDLKYGYKEWLIPKVRIEMKKNREYYFWLARLLLQGDIIDGFKVFFVYFSNIAIVSMTRLRR